MGPCTVYTLEPTINIQIFAVNDGTEQQTTI